MYNKKVLFVRRTRPFLIIVYAHKNGRRKKSTLTPLVFSFSLLHEDSIINLKTSVTLAALFSLLRLILPGLKVLVFTSASV